MYFPVRYFDANEAKMGNVLTWCFLEIEIIILTHISLFLRSLNSRDTSGPFVLIARDNLSCVATIYAIDEFVKVKFGMYFSISCSLRSENCDIVRI